MKTLREIEKEYQTLHSKYEKMTEKAKVLLTDLLNSENVNFNILEARTKSFDSFMYKVKSKSAKYQNPMNDITDIIGLRVIVNYQDEVDKVIDIIQREFEIDYQNSVDKGKLLNPNEFGYRSVHYVTSLSKDRLKLVEWEMFRDVRFEIQVRTILQHSWALISHSLQYKKENGIPNPLRRKLFRLAGLIELADDEFIAIRDDHEKLKEEINNENSEDFLSLELNTLSMKRFLLSSDEVEKLQDVAQKSGFEIIEEDDDDYDYNYDDAISELLMYCEVVRIVTVNHIKILIENSLMYAERYMKELINLSKDKWTVDISFIITLIIAKEFVNDEDIINLINKNWNYSIGQRVIDAIYNLESNLV